MNERIKLLAEQALNYAEKNQSADIPQHWFKLHTEKFAELIICECAAEADRQTIYCRGIPWGRWLKEHFGLQD